MAAGMRRAVVSSANCPAMAIDSILDDAGVSSFQISGMGGLMVTVLRPCSGVHTRPSCRPSPADEDALWTAGRMPALLCGGYSVRRYCCSAGRCRTDDRAVSCYAAQNFRFPGLTVLIEMRLE